MCGRLLSSKQRRQQTVCDDGAQCLCPLHYIGFAAWVEQNKALQQLLLAWAHVTFILIRQRYATPLYATRADPVFTVVRDWCAIQPQVQDDSSSSCSAPELCASSPSGSVFGGDEDDGSSTSDDDDGPTHGLDFLVFMALLPRSLQRRRQ